MSFEEGTPVTHVRRLAAEGVDLRALARLISESFVRMIFKEGFVHADPHPGNLMVRRAASDGSLKLVILDHGIYTELPRETRLGYTKLWRGILNQNEPMIREASTELGADFYQLFTSMIADRQYDEVMQAEKRTSLQARLGDQNTKEA